MEDNNKYPIQTTYKFNGEEIPFNMRKRIPYHEVGMLVKHVAESVYNDGDPMYYADHLFRDIAVVEAFTDIEFPSDFEELCELIEDSNLIMSIRQYVSWTQYERLVDSVYDAVRDLKNVSEFDLLMSDLRTAVSKFDGNIEEFINPDKINALLDMAANKDKIIAEMALDNIDKDV